MFRMQYRNRGGFETLVFTHTVGAPASSTFGTYRAAPRYYELRSTAGGPFSVFEQATFAPADGVSRWMGSAAEDNQGNLAVGYSASSTSRSSRAYATRADSPQTRRAGSHRARPRSSRAPACRRARAAAGATTRR